MYVLRCLYSYCDVRYGTVKELLFLCRRLYVVFSVYILQVLLSKSTIFDVLESVVDFIFYNLIERSSIYNPCNPLQCYNSPCSMYLFIC